MSTTERGPAPRYDVRISSTASKELAALPREAQRRIAPRLRALATAPRPRGATALSGSDHLRLRIGDYRVIYAIRDQGLLVLVVRVAHRREVYKRK
jgi:mRNA interferase RelE/StbE